MAPTLKPAAGLIAGAIGAGALSAGPARAQSIEPRAYAPAPVGVNFLIAGYTDSRGGLATDGSLPVTDPKLEVHGPIVAYIRSLDLAGRSAKIDVIMPTGTLTGSAVYQGQTLHREVSGIGDPLVRLSVSLVGAPALQPSDFRSYRQDLVVGASLQVQVPLGQYDDAHLVNLGAHRWSFKPELGLSKAMGRWTVELTASATIYTANNDFFGLGRRTQQPIYGAGAHAIYNLRSGPWISLDATYYTGGQTQLNGGDERELQRNWRIGVTAAMPVTRRASIKLNASQGVSARTGNNYDLFGVAWQYRWGGGL
jgi:hypothetical protein